MKTVNQVLDEINTDDKDVELIKKYMPLPPINLESDSKVSHVVRISIDEMSTQTLNWFWIVLLRLIVVILTLGCTVFLIEVQPVVVGIMLMTVVIFLIWKGLRRSAMIAAEWLLGHIDTSLPVSQVDDPDQTALSLMIDEITDHTAWQRRLIIATKLGNAADPRAVSVLSKMLESENGFIVITAAQSLGKIGTEPSISALRHAYDCQLNGPSKQAIGDVLAELEIFRAENVANWVSYLTPRLGCVAWYTASVVVTAIFFLAYLIAFGVLASNDIRDFYEVEIPRNAATTGLAQILTSLAVARGLWKMRVWSINLSIFILTLAAGLSICVLLFEGGLGVLISLAVNVMFLGWAYNNRNKFRGEPAYAVPNTQKLTSLQYVTRRSTRLLQLHRWLTGLTLLAVIMASLSIVPQAKENTLIWLGCSGFFVVLPNWRISRKLWRDGSYAIWGTLLVWLSMMLIFSMVGLVAVHIAQLADDTISMDKLTGIAIGFLIASILGMFLSRHARTWQSGPPIGALSERTRRYVAIRWGLVGVMLAIPFFFTVISPSLGELSDRLRDVIEPPNAESVHQLLVSRIAEGHAAVDIMDERWETLQNGGRVQCNRPEIPRRIQVTQSIADENPNLVEAVALYHSGIELINESAAILFEGCRTEITLEVYLSRFRQAEGARDQFLAAEAALQRQQP